MLVACSDNKLILLNGEHKNISDYKGKWLLVNYWAAWCKPCLKEIPEFNTINLHTDVEVLAFNYDELDERILKEQVSVFDIRYHSLINDPSKLFKQDKPTGLPATMVINSEGRFVEWLYGAQTQESLMKVLSISHF